MANVLYFPVFRAFDSNGDPLAGGKVYTYVAGTSTPKDTYTDSTMATTNANPVILDAQGSAPIWTSGTYKINLTDANDVQQDDFPVDQWTNDSGTAGPAGTFAMVTAAGTADAITANYTPDITLSNLTTVGFVAASANATTTPTFAPDGLTAHTITKKGGVALVAGDIQPLMACIVEYNSANTRWELLNPATSQLPWVASGGTADVITATYSPAILNLYDGQRLTFRASGANTVTTPTFSPNGLTARTITKTGGSALAVGDIAANLAEYVVIYNLANTRWELQNPSVLPVPFSAIAGFLPSSIAGTSTTASLTVSAGQATDSTNVAYVTKSTTTSWAASNGNAINGTDAASSTLANSTTYHMFVCSGTSGTGTFCSASLTPTFPTGYTTYKRRIFSFNTTAAGAPIPYTAIETDGGSVVNWLTTQILDINVSNLSTTRTAYALTVPGGIKVSPIYRATTGTTAQPIIITSGDESDVAPGTLTWTTAPGADLNGSSAANIVGYGFARDGFLTTNTSSQINARATGASTTLYLVTRGFKDFRRA